MSERNAKSCVSIIVPVYNVDEYLDRCLESLVQQSFKNIEILLIDDGSTDCSGEKCDYWSTLDERIKVIHQKNMGLGEARNTGICNCSSELITFVDSDDWVEHDMIEILVDNLRRTKSNISIIGSRKVNEFGKAYSYPIPDIFIDFDNDKSFRYINCPGYFDIAAWGKLYQKELFSNIKFPAIKNAEDYPVMYKLLDMNIHIVYDSRIGYNYFQRENGLSRYISINPCKFTYEMLNLVKKKYPEMLPYARYKHMDATAGMANIIYREGKSGEWNEYLIYTQRTIKDTLFSVYRYVNIDNIWFIRLFLMGFSPNFYKFIYLLLRKSNFLKSIIKK